MDYFLLALSVVTGSSKSLVTKYVKTQSKGMTKTMLVNVISFLFGLVFLLAFAIVSMAHDGFNVPILIAFAYAVCTFGSQYALMKAVEYGSVAISSLFYSCGFVIPTVWGCVHYREGINAWYIVGFVLILASFVLSVDIKKSEKFNFKWLIAALGGTLFSGLVGVIQKLFTNEYNACSMDQFLTLSFLMIVVMSAVAMLISYLLDKKKGLIQKDDKPLSLNKKALLFTVILGVILGGHNKICTYLAGVLESFIMFPVCNGGVIALTAVLSTVIFKEKLSKKQLSAVIIGFLAIIVIAVGKIVMAKA